MCQHEQFRSKANVHRLTDGGTVVTGYSVSFHVECEQCGLPFRFRGSHYGSSYHEPMLSADGLELRAPIEPAHVTEILGHPLVAGRA